MYFLLFNGVGAGGISDAACSRPEQQKNDCLTPKYLESGGMQLIPWPLWNVNLAGCGLSHAAAIIPRVGCVLYEGDSQ